MNLSQYMIRNDLSDTAMAQKLECSVGAVRKWRSGERMPRKAQVQKIHEVTKGQVAVADFYERGAA